MLLKDFLIGVYGLNKAQTQPSHLVYKFAEKNELELNKEYSKVELYKIMIKFSTEKTRIKALNVIESIKDKIEKVVTKISVLREETYKKCCSIFHPDNLETGDNESFKFIQEIKEFLWDYNGKPRKEIKLWHWNNEKEFTEGGGFKYGFTYRKS